MSFRITFNRPIIRPGRYTTIAQTCTETSKLKGPGICVFFTEKLDHQYGNRILQALLSRCNASTPIDTFNRTCFFVVFFPIIWLAIVSEAVSSICRTSRYPIITIFFSEVLLLTCLARYTAFMIVSSTMIGGVALSAHPIAAGAKSLSPFVSDHLSRLEFYLAQRAGSFQALLEDSKTLLPTWIEDEWCEVTQADDLRSLSGYGPELLPHPGKKSKSPPRVLPKVRFEVEPPQAQKPGFGPEGWLLV